MDDLISEFIAETMESLTALDSALIRFEKDPENVEALGNIFRLVHTIKGTCGFLGLSRLEALTHASENVLGKLRAKTIPVSAELISTVLESLDATKSIVEYIGTHGTEPAGDDAELIRELDAVADGQAGPETGIGTQSQAVVEDIFPAQPEETADDAAAASSHVQSIRVNLGLLENLMEMVGELVLTRNQMMQAGKMQDPRKLSHCLQQLNQITSELQEGVMKTRMQPIGNAWSKFPRLIRELSHELNKKITLRMIGADTELDRQLLEALKDPLTHMIRNSADHGLEPPEERLAAGKPDTGTVTLSAFHEGGHIIIEMSDDGRGLNIEKIKQRALKNGLATEEDIAKLTSQQIVQFIFLPGFSTADKVTNISGRGVGMDVVRYNIEKIGGTLELTSFQGKGSKFNIKIPLTLAIASMLIVKAGSERFALPQLNIQEVVRIGAGTEHTIEHIHTSPVMRLRGKLLPILSLTDVLGLASGEDKGNYVIVCKVGGYSFGLRVERILDIEEIVIKPISEVLKSIPIYSGNAILGDGSIIMTLDPHGLARASGAEDVSSTFDTAAMTSKTAANDNLVSLLLFRSQSGAVRAVPLELITRIEKIDMATVEQSGIHPVIQYKNGLMRLHTMTGEYLPQKNTKEVIVFSYDNAYLGLVADKALDIVNVPYDIKLASNEKGLFGSMVINGKAMDVVDVGHMLRDLVGISDVEGAFAATDRKYELLLVENSAFFRSLTIPLMISVGYKVTAVKDANEALKALEANPRFDIIVSDIEMPGMDGFAFAECCHKNSKISHIPLFAYSSSKTDQAIQKSRQCGFQDLVLKTDQTALLKSIAIFFQQEKGGQHARHA
jgi:two-component system chemotaxis sensor kinase CheA